MNLQKVAFGEVCDFVRGVSFDGDEAIDVSKEGYVPILRAGNIGDELYIQDDLVWVPEKRVSEEQYFQVGDIAICMASGSPAVLGKTAQLKESFFGSVGAFCGIIRPTKADPNYIAYWLKSSDFMAWRDSQANGVNIQNLRPNEIREIKIPLPPLTEQKRIASLLARADRLRQLRRTAHHLGDALLQSVFLEMFGNIAINERNFPRSSMEELCPRVTVGYVGPTSEFYTDNNGIPFLRTQNVRPIQISRDAMQYVTPEFHKKNKKTQIRKDDVLVSRVGVNRGMAAVVPADLDGANCANVLITSPGNQLNSIFLAYLINSTIGQEQLLGVSVGSAQGVINTNSLGDWSVAVPPLSLQEEFVGVVARGESLRVRMGESERQVEGLFQSLLVESFG